MRRPDEISQPASDWPPGLRRTRPRQRVLEILDAAEQPLSALEIGAALQLEGEKVWPSTIYRILDRLVAAGLALESEVSGRPGRLYERKHQGHRHYAVCLACKRLFPLPECPLTLTAPPLPGFQVLEHRLEFIGFCQDCRPRPITE